MEAREDVLFSCWIQEVGEDIGFLQEFFARASGLGEAIMKVRKAAMEQGCQDPVVFQCDPVELDGDVEGLEPGPEAEVFWSVGRVFFDPGPGESEPDFVFPWGVVPSSGEGEVDTSEIGPGFERSSDEDGIEYLGANVSEPELFPLYCRLLQLHPSYAVFWYVLHGHWAEKEEEDMEGPEEGPDRFLVNEDLSTPEKIIAHLESRPLDSVRNGFVTLTAYLEEGETNLSISDHKRIMVSSRSPSIVDAYQKTLEEAGLGLHPNLASIDAGVHHRHYRLPGSLPKEDLARSLLDSGFRVWDRGRGAAEP